MSLKPSARVGDPLCRLALRLPPPQESVHNFLCLAPARAMVGWGLLPPSRRFETHIPGSHQHERPRFNTPLKPKMSPMRAEGHNHQCSTLTIG